MSDNSRPTGVTVYPMTELSEVNGPVVFGRYALMIRHTPDGEVDLSEVRMVHTEGVAYKVTDDKPWRWTDYGKCETFTPEQLLEFTDDERVVGVDLSTWVRSFGARLESNFHQCYAWATGDSE